MHRLTIFPENEGSFTVMNIFFCFIYKIDKVVTIYSKFRFDYHKGKQLGMVNTHLPLNMSLFSSPFWI